jgi:hypothetical protein
MKITELFLLLPLAAAGQRGYSCVLDGIPAISITAAQGTELPAREFFLPLFAKCTDAELRRPLYHLPGTLTSRLAPSDSDQQQE